MNDLQKDILIGSLLGDGSIERQPRSKNARFKIYRSIKDRQLANFEYEHFKEFCLSGLKSVDRFDKRYNKINTSIWFRTRALPEFTFYHNKWYLNKKKIVPADLRLNQMIIAKWFADDGSVYKTSKNAIGIKFCTDGFLENEVEFLSSELNELIRETFYIYKRKNKDKIYYRIGASHIAACALFKYIDPIFTFLDRKRNIWLPFINKEFNSPKYRSRKTDPAINLNELNNILLTNNYLTLNDLFKNFNCTKNYIWLILKNYYNLGYVDILKSEISYKRNYYKITELGKQKLTA